MEILIGAVAAVIFFLFAYKLISPSKSKVKKGGTEQTKRFVCDVCKADICECRPENESIS